MAASGLQHVPVEKRNPLITTTKGTGELILHALDQGVEYIILGLGGSATNDGGAGMLEALGVRFINGKGEVIDPSEAHYTRLLLLIFHECTHA